MSAPCVEYKVNTSNGVACIKLQRPDVLNSLNKQLCTELVESIKLAENDRSVRAIILTGSGKGFCAGQDLAELQDPSTDVQSIVRDQCNVIATAILTSPLPFVCAVNGVAAGAGANLSLCCDFVLASDTSLFIQAFINVGLIPDTAGTFILPRLIGTARTKALCMLGEKISATEAERIGMIYKSCPAASLEEEARSLAERLAQLPTKAISAMKTSFLSSTTNSLAEQLELEEKLQSELSATDDYQEGVQAFLEKRKAKFTGS